MQVGERVLAYNPKTGKMEQEPILHVWINHDHDLVDLTITTTAKGQRGKAATKTSEVVHTTSEHPFFTTEQGFVPAGKLKLGMHVLRADGSVGVITGWKVVPGTQVMYNLEVAQDHTFTVGSGQWVVHNTCTNTTGPGRFRIGPYGELAREFIGLPFQAHHIFQDAMMECLPGYSYYQAPAIALQQNPNHATATGLQRNLGITHRILARFFGNTTLTFFEAQDTAEQVLTAGGVGGVDFNDAMQYAINYFMSKWSPSQLNALCIPKR